MGPRDPFVSDPFGAISPNKVVKKTPIVLVSKSTDVIRTVEQL